MQPFFPAMSWASRSKQNTVDVFTVGVSTCTLFFNYPESPTRSLLALKTLALRICETMYLSNTLFYKINKPTFTLSATLLITYHHPAVCLTTGPQSLPMPAIQTERPTASSFNFLHPFVSLKSSSRSLHLLPCFPSTSIPTSIFPSITFLRRQFPPRHDQPCWPFLILLCVWYSSPPWLCVTLHHFSHDHSNWSSPSISNTTFQNFQVFRIYFAKCPSFSSTQSYVWNAVL